MELSTMEDDIREAYEFARGFFQQGDCIKALEIIEDSILVHGKSKSSAILHWLQGTIFCRRAKETDNSYVKCTYFMSALESSFNATLLFPCCLEFIYFCASSLFNLGQQFESNLYYEKAVNTAKQGLSLVNPEDTFEYSRDSPSGTQGSLSAEERIKDLKKNLEALIELAEANINPHDAKTLVDFSTAVHENESSSRSTRVVKKRAEIRKSKNSATERLRSFWAGMSFKCKRDFMKVNIEKLKCYVEGFYGSWARETLERGLVFAKTSRKWKLWKCGTCSKEFRRSAECKKHLEQEHAAKFRPSLKDVIPERVDEIWVEMICSGDWEPVDITAAVEIIKNQLVKAKEFVYDNGWSKDWPLSNDGGRRNILKEFHQTLMSLLEHKMLARSIRDWMIRYTVESLELVGLPQYYLDDCGLVNTPQCICFLERNRLEDMQWYLRRIRTDDRTDLISKAVDGFWERARVKERINFDSEFSCLLLDKRLLRGKVDAFDDEGTIDVCSSSDHCARVSPQGDEIISWLLDYPLIDKEYTFHGPIREHNLDIWLAVLRIIECRCKNLETKYKKKLDMLAYEDALIEAKELFTNEDERRRDVPNDQWNTYASILPDKCWKHVMKDDENSNNTAPFLSDTILFLSAIRDILEGAISPRFGIFKVEDNLNCISKLCNVNDDFVLESLERLRTKVNDKILLIDPKILLIDNSRSQLLSDLTRLSVFDYRSFIIPLLKCFLWKELEEMIAMDVKARSVAAEAALLSEIEREQKNKSSSRKNKKKSNRRCRKGEDSKETITGRSSPVDQKAELYPSITHESGPSDESGNIAELIKTEEEEHLQHVSSKDKVNITEDACPEDEPSSARDQSKHSFKTNHKKETTTEVMQTMPGSASLENKEVSDLKNDSSTQLVSAPKEDDIRYDSALDMILKSIWHMGFFREEFVCCRAPVHNHVEGRCVLCALQDLFSNFAEQINDDGLYHYLLNDLHLALKVTHPMAKGASELLVAILEFLHSWNSPYRESLVTSLFTLEEFERMSCNRCRQEPNYPEQSSYGLVISANSLREIKSAFEDINFENILKVIRVNLRMFCDMRKGGCGKWNYVHHVLTRFPAIFTIALEWENNETEEEISATTTVLATEIDIGVLYKGANPLTKYHLVSMAARGEKEYNCIAYENDRWVRHDPSMKEDIGDWKDVLSHCREKKVSAALMDAERLRIEEDEWQTCASVLCKKCHELVGKDCANLSNTMRRLLTVLRYVLEGPSLVSIGEFRHEDYADWLSKQDDVEDGFVMEPF